MNNKTHMNSGANFVAWFNALSSQRQGAIMRRAARDHGFNGFAQPEELLGDSYEEWIEAYDHECPLVRFLAGLRILCSHRKNDPCEGHLQGTNVTVMSSVQVRHANGTNRTLEYARKSHRRNLATERRGWNGAWNAVHEEWEQHGSKKNHMVRLATIAMILDLSETELKNRLATPGTEEHDLLTPHKVTNRTVLYDGLRAVKIALKPHLELHDCTTTTSTP